MSSATGTSSPHVDLPLRTKYWRGFWMIAAVLGIIGVVLFLMRPLKSAPKPAVAPLQTPDKVEPVRVTGPGRIAIEENTSFQKQLSIATLNTKGITDPALSVSGSILGRVHPGPESLEDRWQFSSAELSTNYADWLRVNTEIQFAESQLKKTRELVQAETAYRDDIVKHLQPLMKSGSVAERNVKQAEADLLRTQLEGEKNIYQAEATLRTARKTKAGLERGLSQAGIEPIVFSRVIENMVLVSANVPEARVSQVREGQACQVRFYGYPDKLFPAHVEALGSSLTPDRRTLRVLFELNDPEQILRPGMFGDVGLGTEERDAILVSTEALLHIDRKDYVLVATSGDEWNVTEVSVGEIRNGTAEILAGLAGADRVITSGSILLKPAVVQALALSVSKTEQK